MVTHKSASFQSLLSNPKWKPYKCFIPWMILFAQQQTFQWPSFKATVQGVCKADRSGFPLQINDTFSLFSLHYLRFNFGKSQYFFSVDSMVHFISFELEKLCQSHCVQEKYISSLANMKQYQLNISRNRSKCISIKPMKSNFRLKLSVRLKAKVHLFEHQSVFWHLEHLMFIANDLRQW